jgi:hypothetical protein
MAHDPHYPALPATFAARVEAEEMHECLMDLHDDLKDILDKLEDIRELLAV